MPNRRKSYILTETAVGDFREARRWSVARLGMKRMRSDFQQLHDDSDYMATHQPAIAARDDLLGNTDLGVYPAGEHYLVYVPENDTQIVVVALIRQSRDVPAILKASNFQIRRQLIAALKILRARQLRIPGTV